MFQSLLLATTLTLQQLNCFPLDAFSNDRAVFTLELPAKVSAEQPAELPVKGTLFLSSGIDDWGNQETTGVLPLHWAARTAEGKLEYVAENETSRFRISLDRASVGQVAKDIEMKLFLETKDGGSRAEQDLTCYSNVFEYERAAR